MNIVLVGGNSDIGRAISVELSSRDDVRALIVSRSSVPSEMRCKRFMYMDGVDLLIDAQMSRFTATLKDSFDSRFTVIHCVGDFWIHRPLDQSAISVARAHIESHYLTLYNVARHAAPVMISVGGGSFVGFSCNSVTKNYPEMAPFTSAKAAVETLIKCIANEYSEFGIQANALALPTIRTEKVGMYKIPDNQMQYITSHELAQIIVEQIVSLSPLISGNVISLFKFSKAFYHKSYFERNPSGRV